MARIDTLQRINLEFYVYLLKRFFFLITFSTFYLNAYSIIFVHIGNSLPSHLTTTIGQARLFNKECPIYLIANAQAIEYLPSEISINNVICISCESLSPSNEHQQYRDCSRHDWSCNGLWVYSTERFFYLEEYIKKEDLYDVFHLENDVMLYVNLEELLPVFKKYYNGMIAGIFEHDLRCVPDFMYISEPKPLTALVNSLPICIDSLNVTDMLSIAKFKDQYHKVYIDHLPVIPPAYTYDHPLNSKESESYFNHFDEFHSVFDAASFGVFLGGWDSVFHDPSPGAINLNCLFNPSYFSIEWIIDQEGRRIPYIEYNGNKIPLNNLHITNKSKIHTFKS